jgi:hypothetical protein
MRTQIHRPVSLILASASLVCLLTLPFSGSAVAKSRPPVDMGDPDGTNDQGPKTGPAGARVIILPSNPSYSSTSPSQNHNGRQLGVIGLNEYILLTLRWFYWRS